MRRLGWPRETGPGVTSMIDTKGWQDRGIQVDSPGGIEVPIKVKASLLWGDYSPMYEVSLKPVDFEVCEFRHKTDTEATNMSRWVDSAEIAEKLERTVKEVRRELGWGMFTIQVFRGGRHQRGDMDTTGGNGGAHKCGLPHPDLLVHTCGGGGEGGGAYRRMEKEC